jgi:hypothetical protein
MPVIRHDDHGKHRQRHNRPSLDDNKLTYFHAGRYKQLSQFGGELIPELLA